MECPYCGADCEDPGEGFLAHMKASPSCAELYEHQSASTAEEWRKR